VNFFWQIVFLVCSMVLGAGVGFVLDVAIHRLPRNIPLFSKVSPETPAWGRPLKRRFLVAGLNGILYGALYWYVVLLNGSPNPGAEPLLSWTCLIVYWPLVAGLILVGFVDMQDYEETEEEKRKTEALCRELEEEGRTLEAELGPMVYGIIPNEVTYTGLILAIPLALLFPETHWNMTWIFSVGPRVNAVLDVFLGALVGGSLTWSLGVLGKVIFRKAAMGMGDVKLMAMLGALLGWKAVLLIFFLAPFFGTFWGLLQLVRSGEHYLRYGPCIALATLLVLLYEPLGTAYFDVRSTFLWGGLHLHHRVPFFVP